MSTHLCVMCQVARNCKYGGSERGALKSSQKASIVYRNVLVRGILLLVLGSVITRNKISDLNTVINQQV